MSDPWTKHGIEHLSASSLATFRNEPAIWVMRYLFKFKDEVGPGAWRGTAVEAGLDQLLYAREKEVALEAALASFDSAAQGEVSEDITKERDAIAPMLAQAWEQVKGLGMPMARQLKVIHTLPGIEIPVIGYVDYTFEDSLLDLKTTHRMPSEPSPDHAAQVTVYADALGKKGSLVYATTKKSATYPLTDDHTTQARWALLTSARAIRAFLRRVDTREEAAEMCAPNFENFRWSDAARAEALEIWK